MFALLRVFLCSMFFLRSLSSACKIIINCPATAPPHPPPPPLAPPPSLCQPAINMKMQLISALQHTQREICMGSPHAPHLTVKLCHRLAEAGSQRMHTIAITINISITVAFRYSFNMFCEFCLAVLMCHIRPIAS